MTTNSTLVPRQLAAFGGRPAVPQDQRSLPWPVILDTDRNAVIEALDGRLVSDSAGATPVSQLEQQWAMRTGTSRCVATANGTSALALTLFALGIKPGYEVIVPALSFIASAMAPVHQMAVPVFADIDPVTFCVNPAAVEAAVTARTAAIVPVHLHGQPADMDAINAIARRHGLAVLEDAAQAQGARYHDQPVGSLGIAAAFSLQATKNLPTCGEGGLVTTSDERLADRIEMARQFGEVIDPQQDRDYVSYFLGWNGKMSSVQAAFTLSQLTRFDDYAARRAVNVAALLDRLGALPGLITPKPVPGTVHAWHILRLRFDPDAAGLEGIPAAAFRAAAHRLLRAEGVPVSRYQLMPLPQQPVFTERAGFGNGYPWRIASPQPSGPWPVTQAVVDDSLTIQKRHLNPYAGPALRSYADAFEKLWENLNTVAAIARSHQ